MSLSSPATARIAPGRSSSLELGAAFWLTPVVLALALLTAEYFNHTLFHTLAEFFAIAVALLAAVVGWQAYPFSRNDFLIYLACGYFWIGGLDLGHALTYKGMGLFPGDTSNLSIQFWIGTRYLEALLLLTAPWMLSRTVPRHLAFWGFGALAVLLVSSVVGGWFPTAFVPGEGLTSFKVISEYVIIATLAMALLHLWQRRAALDAKLVGLMVFSILFTAAAEFSLTIYSAVGEAPTVVGHLLKLLSYWLIYQGVIATTLTEPFRVLARGASTFDAVPEPTVVVDERGIVRQCNRAARRFLGMDEAACVGRHSHDLFHGDGPAHACPICAAVAQGIGLENYEVELARGGQWHEVTLSPITSGRAHAGTVHVSRDVTQRKAALRALRQSEARFRGLVENTNDWVWELSADGFYTYASPQVSEMLGYAPEELIGRSPLDLMPPEEAQRVGGLFADHHTRRAAFKGLENVNLHKDGSTRVLETNGVPFFDDAGALAGYRGIDRDITERKRIEEELRRHRNELELLVEERTRALEAANRELESFSYSVSHDLRAPLRSMDGFSRLLSNKYADALDAQGRDYIQRIVNATARMARLIDDMLHLSRVSRAPLDRRLTDLSAIAAEVAEELRADAPQRAVELRIVPGLTAQVDPGLIRIALHNLLGNACKFTAGRSPAVIEFGCSGGPAERVYHVRDNGAGFDMQYVGKLFGAFQRLHGPHEFEGTGIGLATVQRVVQRHGGRVWAEGAVDEGATFYFTLAPGLSADDGTDSTAGPPAAEDAAPAA